MLTLSPTVTMDPSITPPTSRWPSCQTPRSRSITPSCSRTGALTMAHKTPSTPLNHLYRRNGPGQERIAWQHRRVRHQDIYRQPARKHRNRDHIRAFRGLSTEATTFKAAPHTSNSQTAAVQRVRHLSCKIRCSIHRPYHSACRPVHRRSFRLHHKTLARRHRPCPLSMEAETTLPKMEGKHIHKACHLQGIRAIPLIPQSPPVIPVSR